MIQLPERRYNDYETKVLSNVVKKVEADFDFFNDETFRQLSVQEQYLYFGLIRGMNTILEICTRDNEKYPEVKKMLSDFFNFSKDEEEEEK